jgi:hypothetical protein
VVGCRVEVDKGEVDKGEVDKGEVDKGEVDNEAGANANLPIANKHLKSIKGKDGAPLNLFRVDSCKILMQHVNLVRDTFNKHYSVSSCWGRGSEVVREKSVDKARSTKNLRVCEDSCGWKGTHSLVRGRRG